MIKIDLHKPSQPSAARRAWCAGKPVLYRTELASYRLTPEGIELFEIAPGIDLQRDVLDQVGFVPRVATDLALMPAQHFMTGARD